MYRPILSLSMLALSVHACAPATRPVASSPASPPLAAAAPPPPARPAAPPPASAKPVAAEEHLAKARLNLRRIYDASVSYSMAEHADERGNILPLQFPGSTGWTPAESACQHPDHRYLPRPELWESAVWKALYFSVDDPDRFQYRYRSTGTGPAAIFEAEARADLDCKGTFTMIGVAGAIKSTAAGLTVIRAETGALDAAASARASAPAPQQAPSAPPVPADPEEELLALAQSAYVSGDYQVALERGRAALAQGRSTRALRIIAASSCQIGDREGVRKIWRRLDTQTREFTRYVCNQHGVKVP